MDKRVGWRIIFVCPATTRRTRREVGSRLTYSHKETCGSFDGIVVDGSITKYAAEQYAKYLAASRSCVYHPGRKVQTKVRAILVEDKSLTAAGWGDRVGEPEMLGAESVEP